MRLWQWFLLLNKRLYKKATFVMILVLIPLLVLGYGILAQEESGVIAIALAQEGDDSLAAEVMQELKESSQLIRYVSCDSAEDAQAMVRTGKTDAAWIFAEDMEEKVYRFIATRSRRNAFVRIVERESTVPLMLAREKLSGTVFGCCSEALYLTYIRENVPELDAVTDETLMAHYDSVSAEGDMFEFSYLEAPEGEKPAQDANYLLTPVRGLLAVVVVLSGLATAMYYIRDEQAGTFSWVAERRKSAVEFGCQLISVLNVSVVVLIALAAVGLTVSLGREVLLLILYAICTALFSMTMRRLCGSLSAVGTILPLMIVVMLVICPVFFDLGTLRELQYLFPPTYYINAVHSDRYLILMGLYSLCMLVLYFLVGKVLRRR